MKKDNNNYQPFSFATGVALVSGTATAFTTALPVVTGALIAVSAMGAAAATVDYFKHLGDEKKTERKDTKMVCDE